MDVPARCPKPIGEENKKGHRRGDQKTIDWDAAMLLRSRFLTYSRPSSTSDFCSNGSVESVAPGSSGGLEARVETEGDGPTEMERESIAA